MNRTHRDILFVSRVLGGGLQDELGVLVDQLLHGVLDELIERVQLLAHQAFLLEERRNHLPAILLRDLHRVLCRGWVEVGGDGGAVGERTGGGGDGGDTYDDDDDDDDDGKTSISHITATRSAHVPLPFALALSTGSKSSIIGERRAKARLGNNERPLGWLVGGRAHGPGWLAHPGGSFILTSKYRTLSSFQDVVEIRRDATRCDVTAGWLGWLIPRFLHPRFKIGIIGILASKYRK